MISYTEFEGPILASLDAEDSQRYLPDQDIIPALNAAFERANTAIRWALANRQSSEEALRELTYTRIFQTNSEGGVSLDAVTPSLGHNIWNILAVYAEPITVESNPQPTPGADSQSLYRADLSWSGSGKPVERISVEEVARRRDSAFLRGNEVLAGNPKRRSFAYYIPGVASSDVYDSGVGEIRVIPQSITSKALIGITYLAEPTKFTSANYTTASIEYPKSMLRMLVGWTLEYLSYKQGDGTTLNSLASKDAQMLFGTTVN